MASIPISSDAVRSLVDRLEWSGADPADERACILALVGVGLRAAVIAGGLDEALAELRRRRARPTGGAAASHDGRIAA